MWPGGDVGRNLPRTESDVGYCHLMVMIIMMNSVCRRSKIQPLGNNRVLSLMGPYFADAWPPASSAQEKGCCRYQCGPRHSFAIDSKTRRATKVNGFGDPPDFGQSESPARSTATIFGAAP